MAGSVLLLGLSGGAFAKPPQCTITSPQNDPVNVTAGGAAEFQGVVTAGVPPYDVTWAFEGGMPLNAQDLGLASGETTVLHQVTFQDAGTYTVTMAAQDSGTKGNTTCSATRTVEVSGDTNSRPVAQDDEYNTTEGMALTIDPPGVLGTDNDPDGDPMAAVLVDNVPAASGTLILAADGGFTYTPAAGFTGPTSFTYTANDAGGPSNVATVAINVAGANEVSINSTSANGTLPPGPVQEVQPADDAGYTLVAINDLGMHCGDLDTRISSILPPFNVLHAQVVERGISGLPRIMNEGEVDLYYTAASNPDDPVLGKQALSSVVNGEVYKTNFWDVASQGYAPFYPPGILDAFYDPNNPANNVDIGLPVPDVERLYLGDGELHAVQQAMPGLTNPYLANNSQPFEEHITDLPFFINPAFQFGYVATSVNWFEAAGVPIAAFDDFGRENPYPLVRVEARVGPNTVDTLDTVMPISGEANCQGCHADPTDGGNGTATGTLNPVTLSIDDPLEGTVPYEVSVEWASDRNILRLHDQEHGTTLEGSFDANTGRADDPVVCQRCHYTPALDLAQVGPSETANGRDQVKHKSMSNVMHSHHASTGLFPDMPPAIDAQGNRRDPLFTLDILEQTCYRCHPGTRTQCLRGAMANGGLVCQDCHGQLAQVGDDFSRNVSPENPGAFELAADFYDYDSETMTESNTPRVPWANEPSCGSCHTGYATDNLAGDPNVLVNPTDTRGNPDGIRLLAAYRVKEDPQDPDSFIPLGKAAAIVPTNKAFAEEVVAQGRPADGNPMLYRVSNGHGGLFCEACHGSTHAEWPTANPSANDNLTANQLQGHSGYIAECQTCHEPTDTTLPLGNNGPHGMHPVSDLQFSNPDFLSDDRWNLRHRSYRNDGPGCESCHGPDLRGTVLSRTAEDRTVRCKDSKGSLPGCAAGQETAVIPKGTPVGCGLCHRQK